VGEIGEDGTYKVADDATEERQTVWVDNAIWIPETVASVSDDDGMVGMDEGVWIGKAK
jgi:hypothetical protein